MPFCVIALAVIAAINLIVDPYAVFRLVQNPHINQNRLELHSRHSEVRKEIGIISKKPLYILLGSSVVDNGFRVPGNLAFSYETPQEYKDGEQAMSARIPDAAALYPLLYNAGIRGGGIPQAYRMLQHAYTNNPRLKRVIAGVEFNLFAIHNDLPATDAINHTYVPASVLGSLLFSTDSLNDAISTFERNAGYPPDFILQSVRSRWHSLVAQASKHSDALPTTESRQGLISPDDLHLSTTFWGEGGGIIRTQDPRDSPILYSVLHTIDFFVKKRADHRPLLETDTIDDLRSMKRFCDRHNIELQLFINPQPALYWAAIRNYGLEPYVEQWLRTLADITPYYAFTESIDYSDRAHDYFKRDIFHYEPAVGEVIFPTLWYHEPPQGDHTYTIVTKDNIDAFLAWRRHMVDTWLENNPYYRNTLSHHIPFKPTFAWSDEIVPRAYEPAVKGLRVVGFLGAFYALPASEAPYDVLRVLNADYAPFYHADTLDELVAAINVATQTKSQSASDPAMLHSTQSLP